MLPNFLGTIVRLIWSSVKTFFPKSSISGRYMARGILGTPNTVGPCKPSAYRNPMAKKANDEEPGNALPTKAERTPPLLSEKMIAKLQSAVNAARSNRISQRKQAPDMRAKFTQGELDQTRSSKK